MNPSIYPISVATWNLMRQVLPEINKAYFHITINWKDANFRQSEHSELARRLQTLGSLCYAACFKEAPPPTPPKDGLSFGDWYIGQTVKVKNGIYSLIGNASAEGQLALFTGLGDLFPDLAYYSSMAMVNPEMVAFAAKYKKITIREAFEMKENDIRDIFESLNSRLMTDSRLQQATEDGQKIIAQLSP
ncbi:hypothetical protein HYU92_04875 [Candidatus Curtissbacteria bacterium]|nr:hypothetical protein [Candidatus Curtissbacteria bacterium]